MFNWVRAIHPQAKEEFTRHYERGRGMAVISDLPFSKYADEVVKAYASHDVTIVTAATGMGKTVSVSFSFPS